MQGSVIFATSLMHLICLSVDVEAAVCSAAENNYRIQHCPAGWVRYGSSKCFKFFPNIVNQSSARESCESLDSTLACVGSAEEHEFLKSYTLGQYKSLSEMRWVWLGGEPRGSRWFWADSTPFVGTISSWLPGAWENYKDGYATVMKTGDDVHEPHWGTIVADRADKVDPYICQKYQMDTRTVIKV